MSSWKSTTSSRLHNLKDYLSQHREDLKRTLPIRRPLRPGENGYIDGQTIPQSWKQWAGQKIKRNHASEGGGNGIDELSLFPGWATRRYNGSSFHENDPSFDVDIYVSGYATSRRPPGISTRSQRAFIRLAKGFASLPKIQGPQPKLNGTSDPVLDDELLASLPPRPWEISDDFEAEVLEERFKHVEMEGPDMYSCSDEQFYESEPSFGSSTYSLQLPSQQSISSALANTSTAISSDIQRLHANLESRLQLFWSSALSSRTVRIHVFVCSSGPSMSPEEEQKFYDHGPILIGDVITGSDGSFSSSFIIPWKDICTHPLGPHIAFGDPTQEPNLIVAVELLPPPVTVPAQFLQPSRPAVECTQHVSITDSPVRVISDIDDTVKMSGVTTGARAIFQNVFVKDLQDIVIPGMGEWYAEMWQRGVRFHYVSNSPFELLPVITQFFDISKLPPGSIKLRSYAGRSLFNGLLSAPATRKRGNVMAVLDSFPHSQFILIGDSGEQDLELYASTAQERPSQILAIFIRDVTNCTDVVANISNPMGTTAFMDTATRRPSASQNNSTPNSTANTPPGSPRLRKRTRSELPKRQPTRQITIPPLPTGEQSNTVTPTGVSPPGSYTAEPISYLPPGIYASPTDCPSPFSSSSSLTRKRLTSQISPMLESQKKRLDLQLRVNRARAILPTHTVLRVFKNPTECVEAHQILDNLNVGKTDTGNNV